MSKLVPIHGRDHRLGGADPIPLLPTSRYSFQILDDPVGGLVLYWKFDELGNTTTDAADSSGNGFTGTYGSGTAHPTLGVAALADGTAAQFDGSNDIVVIGGVSTPVPLCAFGQMSIAFWVKTTAAATGSKTFVGSDDSSSDGRYFKVLLDTGGGIKYDIFDTAANGHTATGSIVVNDGVRHFVVCTFDGTDMKIYVDGVLDVTVTPTMTHPLANACHGMSVGGGMPIGGGFHEDDFIAATFDEVALYTIALPLDSIQTDYLIGSQASNPPSGTAGGDLTGNYPDPELVAFGDGAETVGDSTHYPIVTVDAKGRVSHMAAQAISGGSPSGAAGGDLAGTYPNPTLAAIGSATGPIGDGTHVPVVTIDTKGRVTGLTSAAITGGSPSGAAGGALDGTYPNPGIASSVAGAGLAETSDVLSVNVDDSTIEINTDTLRVKDAGITLAKLNTTGAADGKWLRDSSGAMVWDSIDAADAAIADAGGYFTSTDVEGALQELGAAGAAHGVVDVIYDSGVIGSNQASIDTGANAIPTGYKKIEIGITARTTKASSLNENLEITLNGDTGANYQWNVINGGSTVASNPQATSHAPGGGIIVPAATAPAGILGDYCGECTNYDAANHHGLSFQGGYRAATSNPQIILGWLSWAGAAAINQIAISSPSGASILAGSRMWILGVG